MKNEDFAQSAEEWVALARLYEVDARVLLKNKRYNGAYREVGFSVEAFLKAAIVKHQRRNCFPDRSLRPDLYTHDLGYLFKELGVDLKGLHGSPIVPNLIVLLGWRRAFGYQDATIKPIFAKDMYDAAFGRNGVVEWICSTYRLI